MINLSKANRVSAINTVETYYNYFLAIPAQKWTSAACRGSNGTYCALGLLGATNTRSARDNLAFYSFFGPANKGLESWSINDGSGRACGISFRELGKTPKERTLNALLLKDAGLWDFAVGLTDDDTLLIGDQCG